MPWIWNKSDKNFPAAFTAFVNAKRESAVDVRDKVATILADVRTRGNMALLDYTQRFDRFTATAESLRVSAEEIAKASATIAPDLREALRMAARRIEDFHRRSLPQDFRYVDAEGVTLGARWTAIDAVGIYVPGGLAAYPSSVLMNALPAKVAGVHRIAMAVPAPDGKLNPLVLAAAAEAGVTEIYRIGGAQAIAALAYGTASIAPVDKITGPGNAWVAEAKRQVFGTVGIDMIAGPSEILVVADAGNDPNWIAADLLSQAEHDEVAQAILIADNEDFAKRVIGAIEAQLAELPRSAIARKSWDDWGGVIVADDLLADAPALIDRLAPEHLELAVEDPEPLLAKIRHAGAIFLGRYTPEAIGDYVAGPNHVLPTARTARFASGLNVLDFMKRTTLIGCDAASLKRIGSAAEALATAEGLAGHGLSVSVRISRRQRKKG